jgi:hypothetical protein
VIVHSGRRLSLYLSTFARVRGSYGLKCGRARELNGGCGRRCGLRALLSVRALHSKVCRSVGFMIEARKYTIISYIHNCDL